MTEEQKAIHMLKSYAGMTHRFTDNQGRPKLDQAIETVLNLIQKQQVEIEEQDRIIDRLTEEQQEREKYTHSLEAQLEKKDKIIDLITKELVKAHEWFYSEFDNYTKEDFIKYFENKAEEEK